MQIWKTLRVLKETSGFLRLYYQRDGHGCTRRSY